MHCVLHIGMEKTGTTLIQKWLYSNFEELSEQKVALTQTAGSPNNRKLVSFFQNSIDDYLKRNGIHNSTERESFFATFENDFRSEVRDLKRAGHKTVIISSEHFHSRLTTVEQIRSLKSFLDQFFETYTVLCYFREQSTVRTSLYSTVLRGGSPLRLSEFQNDLSAEDHYYNYFIFFRKWEDVFGKDALEGRVFERDELAAGDLRVDFLNSVRPSVDVKKLKLELITANEALSQQEARIFREINEARPQYTGKHIDPTPSLVKRSIVECGVLSSKAALYDPRQESLYEAFTQSNRKFYKHFFGEDRNPFRKPTRPETSEISEEHFTLDEVAKIVGSAISQRNLIALRQSEVNTLRDLALKLQKEKLASHQEVLTLLILANRACPDDHLTLSKIDELRSAQPKRSHISGKLAFFRKLFRR